MILCVTPNPALDHTVSITELRLDAVNRAESSRTTAGGKGVNVARAARVLGETVCCAGFVGGAQGALFTELAQREGLTTRWTAIIGETRTCTIVLDPARGHNTVINELGPVVGAADWDRLEDDVLQMARKAHVVCLCGSVPPGTPPGRYHRLASRLQDAGLPVWVDVSGAPLVEAAVLEDVNLKINLDEASGLLRRPIAGIDHACAAAIDLSSGGRRCVILTLGASGAVCVTARGRWAARPPSIQRVNAVGSGDSFLAGLLVALERNADDSKALAWACAAGAANALVGGGHFSTSQFETVLAQVTVTPISL